MLLEVGVFLFLLWNSWNDIRKREIVPWSILLFLVFRLLIFLIQIPKLDGQVWAEVMEMATGVIPGILVLIIGRVSRGMIGMGDGLVLIVIGAYIGATAVISVMMWSFLGASVWCMVFLCLKRYRLKSRIPFVPFLLMGYGIQLMI